MANLRSETNAVGNAKFSDLNMTRYPIQVDSKNSGELAYNENMKGFWSAGDANLPAGVNPDYNMAEHVNALADAIIAVQRILGINPHVNYKGGNTSGTVSSRIAAAENKDAYYDARYGGVNWTTLLGQTILTHTHGGGLAEAPQINLSDEVAGHLAKVNLDISQATGLTGADLSMSPTISTKISDAINDKLSVSQGGVVQKKLEVKGASISRLNKEWTASDATGGATITDYKCLTNQARRASGLGEVRFLQTPVSNLLCGKYVLAVRVKINSLVDQNVLRLHFSDYDGTTWLSRGTSLIKGTDFKEANKYQMFYHVFTHETPSSSDTTAMHVWKLATTSSVNLDFDCAWITPVHPAVFDR